MFKKKIKTNTKEYDILIDKTVKNVQVSINGKSYFFENKDTLIAEDDILSTTGKKNSKIVKSPLSGTISIVSVKKGEDVKKGDKLLTIIAMKMENEIVSEGDFKVKEVKVKKDQSVNQNDTLVIFE